MENKVIVLNKNGDWWELTNCFLVGASEEPEKTTYHSVFFIAGGRVTSEDLLPKVEQYLEDMKKGKGVVRKPVS